MFLKKEYNPGSGGKGKYNGGLGQLIEIKSAIDEDMDLLASFDRIKFPARGRLNGSNGKPGQVSIKGKGKLNGKGTQVIKAGISYRFTHLVVLVMEITQKEIRFY